MNPQDAIELLARRPDRTGLLCDFDGTLAEIVDHPDAARACRGAREALERLVGRFALVGLVSGRSLPELARRLAPPGAVLVGSYGLERSDRPSRPPDPEILRKVGDEAESRLAGLPGTLVERKGAGVALHYRLNPDARPDVYAVAGDLAARFALRVRPGKLVAEITLPGPDKGDVVEDLLREFGLEAAMYAGDDVADVDAFDRVRRLARTGVLVAVASEESPGDLVQAADLVLPGPHALVELLRGIAEAVS